MLSWDCLAGSLKWILHSFIRMTGAYILLLVTLHLSLALSVCSGCIILLVDLQQNHLFWWNYCHQLFITLLRELFFHQDQKRNYSVTCRMYISLGMYFSWPMVRGYFVAHKHPLTPPRLQDISSASQSQCLPVYILKLFLPINKPSSPGLSI